MYRPALAALLSVALGVLPCAAQTAVGWRGNGTGLFPDADPPLEWSRTPKGVLTDLCSRADRPGDKAEPDATPLEKGLVREWLLLGPLPMEDSVKDIDKPQLSGEADARPADGDKAGGLAWKRFSAPLDDPFAFGPALPPTADLAAAIGGFRRNQVAYAHTYLYSPKGGTARAVVEHAHGMKAWLNSKEVYREPGRAGSMGNYYAFSRVEFGT
jgi:hypothetical protein